MAKTIDIQLQLAAEDARDEQAAVEAAAGSRVEAVRPLAAPVGGGLEEARFVEPVTMLVTCTLATLAVRLVNHWLKRDERGVQIDLRTDPATVSHLANVPAGVLVVIDAEGKATVHREHYDAPEDVLPVLREFFER